MTEESKKIVHLTKVIHRLNVLNQSHEKEVRFVQGRHNEELDVLRDAYEKRIKAQYIDIERQKSIIENLVEWKSKVTESIAKDKAETKDQMQKKFATAEASFQQFLDEQKQQHSEEKEKFKRDLRVEQKKYDDVMSELNRARQIHVDEKESIRKEHSVLLEREKTTHMKEMKILEQRMQDLCHENDMKISLEKNQYCELRELLLQEQSKTKELELHVENMMVESKRLKIESQMKDQAICDLTEKVSDSLEAIDSMKQIASNLTKDVEHLRAQNDDVQHQNKTLNRNIEILKESFRKRADENDREAIKCAMLLSGLFVQSNNYKSSLNSVQRFLKKRVTEIKIINTSTKQDILVLVSEFKAILIEAVRSIQIQYEQRQGRLVKSCEERIVVQEQSMSLLQKQHTKLTHSNNVQQKVNAEIQHMVQQESYTLRATINALKLLVYDEMDALTSASLHVKEIINEQTSLVIKSMKEKNQKALETIRQESSQRIWELKKGFGKEIQDMDRRRRENGTLIEEMEVEYGKRYRDWDKQMHKSKEDVKRLQSQVNSLDASNRQIIEDANRIQESLTTRLEDIQNQYEKSLANIDELKIEQERSRTTTLLQQNKLSKSISYIGMARSELCGLKQETISKVKELRSHFISRLKNLLFHVQSERQQQQKKFQEKYDSIVFEAERSQVQVKEASIKESALMKRVDYLTKEREKLDKMKSETMSFLDELRKSEADSRERLVEYHEDRYAQLQEKLNEVQLELCSANLKVVDLEKRLEMHRAKEDIDLIEKLREELKVSKDNEKKAIHEKSIFQR